jgi:hypothetical protein
MTLLEFKTASKCPRNQLGRGNCLDPVPERTPALRRAPNSVTTLGSKREGVTGRRDGHSNTRWQLATAK